MQRSSQQAACDGQPLQKDVVQFAPGTQTYLEIMWGGSWLQGAAGGANYYVRTLPPELQQTSPIVTAGHGQRGLVQDRSDQRSAIIPSHQRHALATPTAFPISSAPTVASTKLPTVTK